MRSNSSQARSANDIADVERAIESFARVPNGGLLVVPDATIIAHRDLFISLAARYRLPAVYPWRYFVTAGALMSYGIDNIDVLQKAASYVDRILRGASPVDLPVQAPTKYENGCESQDRKGTWIDYSADAARYRRRGDRVTLHTAVKLYERNVIVFSNSLQDQMVIEVSPAFVTKCGRPAATA